MLGHRCSAALLRAGPAAAAANRTAAVLSLARCMASVAAGAAAPVAPAAAVPPASAIVAAGVLPPRPKVFIKRGSRVVKAQPPKAPLVATYTVQRAGKPLPNLTATSKPPAEKKAKTAATVDAAAEGGASATAASDSGAAAAGGKKEAARWEASTSDSDASASASGTSGSDVSDSEGASTAIVSHEGARPAGGARVARDTLDARRPGHAAATAPDALADAFAIIRLGGRQYKVTPGDVINAEKVVGAEVGKVWPITAEDVLMIGTPTTTIVGRPAIPTATVTLEVEEHAQDEKVVVFHKKRRKRFQLTKGHRRDVTRLRVAAIQVDMAAYQ